MSLMIVPPCSICGREPVAGERWVSVSTWVVGEAVPPEFDKETGKFLSAAKPGPGYRDVIGHLACVEPLVAPMLKKGGQA